MLVLLGIAVIALGFMLRFNPLLVVVASALVTGIFAGLDPVTIVTAFGKAFNDNRYITIIYIVLPVIGILERYGLQVRARELIGRIHGATLGRLLLAYLAFRQITAALGLTSIAGPAQTVRPLIAPMAVAAAERQQGEGAHDEEALLEAIPEDVEEKAKALSAATDNVGLFFGEDIFIAIGSILLMKGVLANNGIELLPLELSVWAIPTAIAAFVIHGLRLLLADRQIARRSRKAGEGE